MGERWDNKSALDPLQDTDTLPAERLGAKGKITGAAIEKAGAAATAQAAAEATAAAALAAHGGLGSGVHGITAAGAAIISAASAAAQRTALGLGTAALSNTGDFEAAGAVATHAALTSGVHGISAFGASLVDDATAGDARTTLELGDAATATQGSGNGLDADTVDGQEASAFAAASHVHAGGDITSGTVAAARLAVMVGDSGAGGTQGAVPAPGAGDAAAGKFLKADGTWVAPAGGIGGSLGATDNAIVRTDGTGGATAQGSAATIDDSGNLSIGAGKLSFYDSGSPSNPSSLVATGSGATRRTELRVGHTSFWLVFGSTSDNTTISDYGYGLNSGLQYGWQNATNLKTGYPSFDTGLKRSAAGVVGITDGSTGIGSLLSSTLVEANTAVAASPNVIAATESGTCFNNTGATALNVHDLPAAAAGLRYGFDVTDADGIKVNATGGATIRFGPNVSGASGFIQSTTVGDFWWLVCDGTNWKVDAAVTDYSSPTIAVT